MEEVEQIAEYVGVVESGKLLMESRLDDIKSNFRLITVSGNCLPTQTSLEVLSVDVEGNFYRYVIAKDAEFFAATLSRNGATITNIAHLSLREIFLQLVRKEKSCTSENAGEVPSRQATKKILASYRYLGLF